MRINPCPKCGREPILERVVLDGRQKLGKPKEGAAS